MYPIDMNPALCRDCLTIAEDPPRNGRCPVCGSPRIVTHGELTTLSIAHVDCDAFYASVEKRDDPTLTAKPVIIGGGRRGVVAAACYVARRYGIRSAMPMFKALELCPQAVVIRPNMEKYSAVGHAIRSMMQELSPLVEPLSIDEAFIDLNGTVGLHGGCPARTLAAFARRVEREIGVTVSVGLSFNKFLAKIASDLDKPRGFAVIGQSDAEAFLEDKPVGILWGVGKALRERMARDGLTRVGDLRTLEEATLVRRYGIIGRRLYAFARAHDSRPVNPHSPAKSISAETTFDKDIRDGDALAAILWRLCEKVSYRLKKADKGGHVVTLKLKTDRFRLLTRSRHLDAPSQLAENLYHAALMLLEKETGDRAFRLIGVGASAFADADDCDPPDFLEPQRQQAKRIENAIDAVRDRFGPDALFKGRGLAAGATKVEKGRDSR